MITKEKLYIAPCSFLNKNIGSFLAKSGRARRLNKKNIYFSSIKILSKNSGQEKIISVQKFEKKYLEKNTNFKDMYNHLLEKKKLYINEKNIFKNKDYLIFGILNITPDSFSDGGLFNNTKTGLNQAKKMHSDGADFIDVGGESTRPGAKKVNVNNEILRVLPILQKLSAFNIPMSLDTRNSSTIYMSNFFGVSIINDVSALRDKDSIEVIRDLNLPIILMHMPGTPKTMMKKKYKNVLLETYDFLSNRIRFCIKNGVPREKIIIDPGIGFGKNREENIYVIKNISIFHSLGCPIMLGVSRKKIISSFGPSNSPKERLGGSLSVACHCFNQGVEIFRVHDVKETLQGIEALKNIERT